MNKIDENEVIELKAEIQVLKEKCEFLEHKVIEHEKLKRQAIGQKIKQREQFESVMWWIFDRANDNQKYVEFNINTLFEEFPFLKAMYENA